MQGDVPQEPVVQGVQPETQGVAQVPQQPSVTPPVVPQTPSEPTIPAEPKKGLKTKKSVIYLLLLFVLIIVVYAVFIAITYRNCSKTTPKVCEINKCDFSLVGFNLLSIKKHDCCGNETCEIGEAYPECIDCPNCDDANICTVDSYDYFDEHKCINKPILDVACCGNALCEEGYETNSDCSKDCPNCDDDSRLTVDSFNYETQKCEHIVTHYFIEDFEAGEVRWESGGEGSWAVHNYDSNSVLKGVGYKWINTGNNEWGNYNFESKIKLVKGTLHILYRLSDVGRYFIVINEDVLSLGKTIFPNTHTKLEKANTFISLNVWHTINIVGKGHRTRVYVDDALMIDYMD
ncbi:hypothetical protein ACFL18_02775, partial [Patescibacteria group bacterium]